MTAHKSKIAREGEQIAATFLTEQGYTILERNWRHSRRGEIDLIAQTGNIVVFVEVKTRTSKTCGDPLESIGRSKQRQIFKLADAYIQRNEFDSATTFRFDAIGIVLTDPPEITHLTDAATADF